MDLRNREGGYHRRIRQLTLLAWNVRSLQARLQEGAWQERKDEDDGACDRITTAGLWPGGAISCVCSWKNNWKFSTSLSPWMEKERGNQWVWLRRIWRTACQNHTGC